MNGAMCVECARVPSMSTSDRCWLCERGIIECPEGTSTRGYRYPAATTPQMLIKVQECKAAGIPMSRLMSERRTREIVAVRRRIAARLKTEIKLSLRLIANELGLANHTSALNLLRPRGVVHTARREDRNATG